MIGRVIITSVQKGLGDGPGFQPVLRTKNLGKPVVDYVFKLDDLNSRSKNFLLSNIEKPGDDLMFALILKNLSDRQISIDKKLIDFIIKRIDRSYGNIFDFIYKVDELSLKKKKPIDFKIIKEILGD